MKKALLLIALAGCGDVTTPSPRIYRGYRITAGNPPQTWHSARPVETHLFSNAVSFRALETNMEVWVTPPFRVEEVTWKTR